MKNFFVFCTAVFCTANLSAQIGVGTTSPNSTLDVRGSLAVSFRAFTSATTAAIADNMLVFTGTSAATLTLPTAATCTGRIYWIKNTSSNASVLTVATTSSQTIDGLASWTLSQTNKAIRVVSNGTNWLVAAESLPGSATGATAWAYAGNNVTSTQNIGTTSNYDFPFITNNTEKMRLTSTGSLGIGTTTFNATYPERLIADAGTTGNTNYQNVIVGKGNTNSYAQLNIQNTNAGNGASSDVVATADNGNETTNYVDLGINSSTNTSGVMGAANDAYLYNVSNNFLIGTGASGKALVFMTGGTTQSTNERMRIDGSGNVGIGTASPAYMLHINATSNPLYLAGVQTGTAADSFLTITNGVVRKISPASAASSVWLVTGNAGTNPSTNFIGTTDAQAFVIRENNSQVGRFDANSLALGTGATINNSTQSYALGSSATVAYGHTNAFAIGNSSAVNADNSFSFGNSAVTNGSYSIAIGNSATANNTYSLAIGPSAITAYGITNATAIGNAAAVNSSNSIAIGTSATIAYSLNPAVAIGNTSVVNGSAGIAIGNAATVGYNANAMALGVNASATNVATNSTAIGYNAAATQANEIILGDRGNTSLSVGIGSESFSTSNKEKLLVDNGASGSTNYQNVIVGKGNTNSYSQLNIQNVNAGTGASSDVVATADNGNETSNYIDMGVNSSANTSTGVLGGANTAYLYSTGNDFVIGNATSSKNIVFFTTVSGTSTERMHIASTGLVPGQDNTYTDGTSTNRWSAVWSANGTIQTSDIRLKKNIEPLQYGLKEVLQLQPVSYDWKDNSGKNKIGLIAQEVKKIVPQVVVGDETKENLGMNYAELVPVLINSIKELNKKIEDLEAQIQKQKNN